MSLPQTVIVVGLIVVVIGVCWWLLDGASFGLPLGLLPASQRVRYEG